LRRIPNRHDRTDRTRSHRRWPNLLTLRLNDPQGDPVGAAAVEGLRRLIEPLDAGRYHVDQIAADPLSSGPTSRRWGSAIKHPDGRVDLDPDPWPA
jgi:hypothetical protein